MFGKSNKTINRKINMSEYKNQMIKNDHVYERSMNGERQHLEPNTIYNLEKKYEQAVKKAIYIDSCNTKLDKLEAKIEKKTSESQELNEKLIKIREDKLQNIVKIMSIKQKIDYSSDSRFKSIKSKKVIYYRQLTKEQKKRKKLKSNHKNIKNNIMKNNRELEKLQRDYKTVERKFNSKF